MTISELIQQLLDLNLRIRGQLEQAEAHVPNINEAIARLAELDLIPETALMGHVVHERQYAPGSGNPDSQILQAAILIPRGVGLIFWSTDDFTAFRNSCGDLDTEPFIHFVPWGDLESPILALLFPELESLLDRLIRMATPRGYQGR